MKVGVACADLLTGMYATVGVLAALRHARAHRRGPAHRHGAARHAGGDAGQPGANYLTSGKSPQRRGNAHPNIVPYQVFADRRRPHHPGGRQRRPVRRFCDAAGRPELAADPRFATQYRAREHRDDLVPRRWPRWRAAPAATGSQALETVGVPCGPINELDEVFADPQVLARGIALDLPHPAGGKVTLVASPMRLSATPWPTTAAAAAGPAHRGGSCRAVGPRRVAHGCAACRRCDLMAGTAEHEARP